MISAHLISVSLMAMLLAVRGWLREDPKRPVSKVVALLEDMHKTLENEQKQDEEIYEKMACWCETNSKEKIQAIANSKQHIGELGTQIEEFTAKSSRLGAEIKALDAEVATNQDSLAQASSIRAKQHDDFNEAEKDMRETITALKSAVLVLSKHHPSFLQRPSPSMISTATALQDQLHRHAERFTAVLSQSQRQILNAFVLRQFIQDPTFKDPYASQSGEIYGILQQMLEQFTADLSDAQHEESDRQEKYQAMQDAITKEIKAAQTQIEDKTLERASSDQGNAQAKQDLEDTKASLSADEKYLLALNQKCQITDEEWADRQKMRQEEMVAVSKALEILNTPDAHDTFTRTFNPSFFQLAASTRANDGRRAAEVLSRIADKLQSPSVSALATMVRMDHFTEVKASIDKIVEELLQEKDEEIKHKDWCVEAIHKNQVDTDGHEREKEATLNNIDALESRIGKMDSEIANLNDEVSLLQAQLAKAGENRKSQHEEFLTTIADQQETQQLLDEANKALRKYYDTVSLAQQLYRGTKPVGPPPPSGFDPYEHQSVPSVIALIDQIIADARKLEENTTSAEQNAQTAYELFAEDTTASIAAKRSTVTDLTDNLATAELDLTEAKQDYNATMNFLEQLSSESADVHESCDFFLKNFEVRQTARDEEVKALRDAKSILSGADFS